MLSMVLEGQSARCLQQLLYSVVYLQNDRYDTTCKARVKVESSNVTRGMLTVPRSPCKVDECCRTISVLLYFLLYIGQGLPMVSAPSPSTAQSLARSPAWSRPMGFPVDDIKDHCKGTTFI